MTYRGTAGNRAYRFADLKTLLAKASALRSGDVLAAVAAGSEEERAVARLVLADVPLRDFLHEATVPYEDDEVTRLIVAQHDPVAFEAVSGLTVGALREWLLDPATDLAALEAVTYGLTPEMVAAVSKIMRNQDLIAVAKKRPVITRYRNTIGLPGHLAIRLQPNHPTDTLSGIAASTIDGLLYGCGDAVIGINPANDSIAGVVDLLTMLDEFRQRYDVPTQNCVLTHVSNTLQAIERGAPVDLVFQSIAGTQLANTSFGIDLALLDEAHAAAQSLGRGTVGQNVMYFETGQGSALSANAHHGVDQQTCEVRAYAVARHYQPLLVNSVVGFIGPEYLYDGKQIIRAGLEDHFCAKLLGLPMGCDICYTNHAEADSDDMDNLLTLLGVAGVNFIMGVPGADDIMLNYQSTSFHDALYIRELLGLRAAPEFEPWLERMGIAEAGGRMLEPGAKQALLSDARRWLGRDELTTRDTWVALRRFTPARIALGRVGSSQRTADALAFGLDHARARDAVHQPLDTEALAAGLEALSMPTIVVKSAASDRREYLLRPDLGRQLDGDSTARLGASPVQGCDVLFVIGDGLSSFAPARHAAPLLAEILPLLTRWRVGPAVIATQARVALADDVGELLGAQLVVMLIGERPGLSSADSLGAYLTFAPRSGRNDAERNCISNIRPEGLSYTVAAYKLVYLLEQALKRQLSGVNLKDDSDEKALPSSLRHDRRGP